MFWTFIFNLTDCKMHYESGILISLSNGPMDGYKMIQIKKQF